MGVIRWQYAVNRASAWIGDIMVAEIDIDVIGDRSEISWIPEGIRFCDGCQIDSVRRYVGSEDEAKEQIEAYVDDWLAWAGLVPKPSYADPQPPLTWRRKQIGNRMISAGYMGKTEVCHVFDPGYHGVKCWIVRVLPSFPGGPTTITTADIFATMDDAKGVAQQLYDRFLLETRVKAGAA